MYTVLKPGSRNDYIVFTSWVMARNVRAQTFETKVIRIYILASRALGKVSKIALNTYCQTWLV